MTENEIIILFNDLEVSEVWHRVQKLQKEAEENNELYKYINVFIDMLNSSKSYVKMRAYTIISILAKWDENNIINDNIDVMMNALDNQKPAFLRVCLASTKKLLLYKPDLKNIVIHKLKNIDLSNLKDTMKPLIENDIKSIEFDI